MDLISYEIYWRDLDPGEWKTWEEKAAIFKYKQDFHVALFLAVKLETMEVTEMWVLIPNTQSCPQMDCLNVLSQAVRKGFRKDSSIDEQMN